MHAQREAAGVMSNIDRAFGELNARGVVARGNFSCCGSCASREIYGEAPEDGAWLGYVYFHRQDAEEIPEAGRTYLGYGVNLASQIARDEWDAMSEADRERSYSDKVRQFVAESVRPVLEGNGMQVGWDGDLGMRISVDGIQDYLVPLEEIAS
ncbi:MAG: DUF6891 domain-containing protein [Propioniciclava sp.]